MKNNKYDVIAVSHFFYPRFGGLENAAYKLLSHLAEKGQRCLSIHGADETNEYKMNDFDCQSFETKNIFSGNYPLFGWKFVQYTYRTIKANPNAHIIIYSRHLVSSLLAAIICKILNRPYYLVEQTAGPSFFNYKLLNSLAWIAEKTVFKFVLKGAYKIISVSKGSKSFITDNFNVDPKKIEIIYNGFDPEDIVTTKDEAKEDIVVFASKFITVKDPQTTLDAFIKVAPKHKNWKFLLIGDSDEVIYNPKTLPKNIIIKHNLLPQKELFELLNKSKIYVNSSLSEGLSLGIVEACAHGNLPVLSDAPSNIEIAEKMTTNSLVFERKSSSDMALKLEKAIKLSQNRIQTQRVITNAHRHFANNTLANRYDDMLENSKHKPKKLSIVIPAYNEENTIKPLLKKISNVSFPGVKKEIIIVEDKSTDKTLKRILNFISKDHDRNTEYIILQNPVNLGKSQSVKRGILHSTGDLVVTQDADLEYNPDNLVQFVRTFRNIPNTDAVYGNRFTKENIFLSKTQKYGNKFLTLFSNLFTFTRGLKVSDMEVCYKMVNGDIMREIMETLESETCFGLEPEVTAKLARYRKYDGNSVIVKQLPIEYHPRSIKNGKKMKFIRDGIYALIEIMKYNLLKQNDQYSNKHLQFAPPNPPPNSASHPQ